MSEHRITLKWTRNGGPFARGNYLPDHEIVFAGGQNLHGSPAPDYGGNPAYADPEQMLVSSLSSCHMLTFLALCANRAYIIDTYTDDAVALLGKNAEGRNAVVKVTLSPKVAFSGDKQPTTEEFVKLHERAHAACFIANSVRTAVEVRAQMLT